jgi:hypothetical protein
VKRTTRTPKPGSSRGGSSIIEILLAISVLMTGLLAYTRSLAISASLEEDNKETALAIAGAQKVVEDLNGTPFDEVFAAFNETQDDDGLVTGTVFGDDFAVAGLEPLPGDADGLPGEVVFPSLDNGGVLELREDMVMAELGMPQDLDLDGAVDGLDHAGDYRVLPVIVRVRWRHEANDRVFEIRTMLGAR